MMVPPQRCFTGGMAQALHTAYRQALILRGRSAWLGKTEAEAIQFLRHGIGSG